MAPDKPVVHLYDFEEIPEDVTGFPGFTFTGEVIKTAEPITITAAWDGGGYR